MLLYCNFMIMSRISHITTFWFSIFFFFIIPMNAQWLWYYQTRNGQCVTFNLHYFIWAVSCLIRADFRNGCFWYHIGFLWFWIWDCHWIGGWLLSFHLPSANWCQGDRFLFIFLFSYFRILLCFWLHVLILHRLYWILVCMFGLWPVFARLYACVFHVVSSIYNDR